MVIVANQTAPVLAGIIVCGGGLGATTMQDIESLDSLVARQKSARICRRIRCMRHAAQCNGELVSLFVRMQVREADTLRDM